MGLRAVFFDAGETLVHPHPSFPELFATIVGREGQPRAHEDVRRAAHAVLDGFSRAASERVLWTINPEASRAFWLSIYERMLTALELPVDGGLAEALYRGFTDRANYVLFDDVVPSLDALATAGLVLGVVSNFEGWLDLLLEDLGVRDRFAVRVISGVEGVEKPNPRIYELALERSGFPPHEVAFVGDNPEFDVDPPTALGMYAVLIDRRGRHEGFAGTRITDLRALPEVLG